LKLAKKFRAKSITITEPVIYSIKKTYRDNVNGKKTQAHQKISMQP